MLKIVKKHFLSLNRILENKLLLNTIYLIVIIIIFTLSIIFLILKKKYIYMFLIDSYYLEILAWIMPTIIIIFLSIYTIKSCFYLNPFKGNYLNIKPLIIELLSLNWKWFFILPKQKICLFNEICVPILIPIKLFLLSNSLMNSVCIPKIGIHLYCMSNCNKNITFLCLKHGFCHGFSSNYNGIGTSKMRFNLFLVTKNSFFFWIEKIKKTLLFTIKDYNILINQGFLNYSKFFTIRNNKIFFSIIKKK